MPIPALKDGGGEKPGAGGEGEPGGMPGMNGHATNGHTDMPLPYRVAGLVPSAPKGPAPSDNKPPALTERFNFRKMFYRARTDPKVLALTKQLDDAAAVLKQTQAAVKQQATDAAAAIEEVQREIAVLRERKPVTTVDETVERDPVTLAVTRRVVKSMTE